MARLYRCPCCRCIAPPRCLSFRDESTPSSRTAHAPCRLPWRTPCNAAASTHLYAMAAGAGPPIGRLDIETWHRSKCALDGAHSPKLAKSREAGAPPALGLGRRDWGQDFTEHGAESEAHAAPPRGRAHARQDQLLIPSPDSWRDGLFSAPMTHTVHTGQVKGDPERHNPTFLCPRAAPIVATSPAAQSETEKK